MTDDASTARPSQNEAEAGRVAGLAPKRLAVAADAADLAAIHKTSWCRNAEQAAVRWQGFGAGADFWEMKLEGVVGTGRGYELAGLMASIGESMTLGLIAAVEAELWRRHRDANTLDLATREGQAIWAAQEMCQRSFAESSLLSLVSAGHGLASLTARLLATNPALRAALAQHLWSDFAPNSDDRAAWLSLNSDTAKALRKVARGDASWEHLAEPVSELVRDAIWRRASTRRDEHWHRRRPQTAGLAGANRAGPWTEPTPGVQMMSLGTPYTDGDGLADDMTDDAIAILDKLAIALNTLASDIKTTLGAVSLFGPL